MSTENQLRDYLKRATAELRQTRRMLAEAEQREHEPIAIVGMSCRFPGGVSTPEQLWQLLDSGGDALTPFPADRGWDKAELYDPVPGRAGRTCTWEGGFLHDAKEFDAGFFGISPREAVAMDPQQRLLLETTWEVFERAGIDPEQARGSRTGVFLGVIAQGYGQGPRKEDLEGYLLTGSTTSVASGRVAYTFGLEGPAVSIDTACSSSLVALHMAVRALRQGECSMALAGGVTVMSTPDIYLELSRQNGLARDGRCKAFADAADGTGFAEGIGMLLVERLSDARANGHQVLAVVRGCAINQDGASNGLTAPSGPAQERAIEQALADAVLTPSDVDAVEAHGTGTTLGDPIEANALLATYGRNRTEPLWLGSVKSNIGHTQAAAGVAGVIKMVLAMRHGVLPKTLHVDKPSSHVDWARGGVEPLVDAREWPATDRPRRAGVSAFGISGTNAHVILEEPPAEEPTPAGVTPSVVPWLISARSEAALREQAKQLKGVQGDPVDIAHALATTRTAHPYRAVVFGRDELDDVSGVEAVEPGKVVFVFPGQGSQWAGMAVELMDDNEVFRTELERCAEALRPHVDWDLVEVLRGGQPLERVDVIQPALFAVMVSLAAVWRSYGVQPDAVVGHSQGEIAAACVAGALSLEDAALVVALRSKAINAIAGAGGMVSVPLPLAKVQEFLRDGVSVAAVNGPSATVVSGDVTALASLVADCEAKGVRARTIPVDYASHSAHVDTLRDELLRILSGIKPRTSEIAFYSTVTGEPVDTSGLDAEYWFTNLRQTVELERTIGRLAEDGHGTFVECSPHPVLTRSVEETAHGIVLGSLRRDDGGPRRMLASVTAAWAHGVPVDLRLSAGTRVDLPTYPFQRTTFWLEPAEPVAADTEFWDAVDRQDVREFAETIDVADDATLAAIVPALSQWRRRRASKSTVDKWRYRLDWRPVPEGPITLSGTWAVLGDGDAVARALTECGVTVVTDLSEPVDGVVSLVGDVDVDVPLWTILRSPVERGLGRVRLTERANTRGGLIDLHSEDDVSLRRLLAALSGTEDQVAIRPDGLYAPRLVRAPQAVGERWRPTGTVLIVGGTGGLGAHVARWVTARGASHVVLVSRRGLEAPGAPELAAELGATVVACDAADRDALAGLFAQHDIRTVIHAANARDDVMRAKAEVAKNLHELATDVDTFILFSGLSATLGLPGQAAAAAADAVIDALAEQRAAAGLPVTCVSWGPWDTGEADAATEDLRLRHGVPAMAPDLAVAALADVVDASTTLVDAGQPSGTAADPAGTVGRTAGAVGETSVVIADIDWERFTLAFTATGPRPVIGDLPEVRAVLTTDVGSGLASQLAGLGEAEQGKIVLDAVRAQIAAVLGHTSGEAVRPNDPFKEIGFDSITGVELRNRLAGRTGLELPATLVFDYPTPAVLAAYLRSELLGTDLRTATATVTASDEPIAIVGMSCRFPGGVTSPDDLWRLVESGTDAVSLWPSDRGWDMAGSYDPDPDATGRSYTREGGFLDQPAHFDNAFFGISPREATAMDPQQRLLLETAWEAFEQAGMDPAGLRGSRTGVFVGMTYQDYSARLHSAPEGYEGHLMMGNTASVTSGRLSYVFGLEGPAVTVDTACSSSLVALHLAAQALRDGECSLALAGAVVVMSTPNMFYEFSRQRGLAPDGRCKAFAASADGFGASEGVGLLVVERLSDAVRNGHQVLAVVRGTAVNQDGASNGLSAPNGPAQQRVIRQALANAGLEPCDVDAVEAHGTGTPLGDPIEAQALLATYGQDREEPLWLGSLKSNIGHAQAAAGVGGVIKMVQAMRHGVLPKTLHVDEPTPHVDWESGAVQLLTEARQWPDHGRPRRSAVSSFGISGTNAHVILEQGPAVTPTTTPVNVLPYVITAKSPEAVRAQAERLATVDADLGAVARALVTTRAEFDHRAVVVAADRDELVRALAEVDPGVARAAGRTVFVFPGQGSQWAGMAADLLDTNAVFAAEILACEQALSQYVDWSLTEVLRSREPIERVDVVQPVLFAVMVSLAALWKSLGVRPDAVVGHSQGEIAAAYVAGALSLSDATAVVALRSKALLRIAGRGGMASIPLPADQIELAPGLDIAVVNGPSATVVSGDADAIDEIVARYADARARKIHVDYASHGPHVEDIEDELLSLLAGITPTSAEIAFYSTVTGEPIDTATMDAGYWYRNLRQTVLFDKATRALARDGYGVFVESSPHPVLTTAVQQTLDDIVVVGSLKRDEDGRRRMLTNAGELYASGVSVDWLSVLPEAGPVALPTYAFQRERFWLEPDETFADAAGLGLEKATHPLLGAAVALAEDDSVVFTARLAASWLAEHAVNGTVILPGAAFAELALHAGDAVGCDAVTELTIAAPLVLGDDPVQLQVAVAAPDEQGRRGLTIHSRSGTRPWTCHATGVLGTAAVPTFDLAEWPPPGAEPVDVSDFYSQLADIGLQYGPVFRGLRAAWRGDADVYTEVTIDQDTAGYGVHPALFDAALQGIGLTGVEGVVLPFSFTDMSLYATGATTLRVHLAPDGPDAVTLRAADPAGLPVLSVDSLAVRPVSADQLAAVRASHTDAMYTVDWVAVPAPAGSDEAADVVHVTGDNVRESLDQLLAVLREPREGRLVVVTERAVATHTGDHIANLTHAPAWGMVRSAESENPGRYVLLDVDAPVSNEIISAALATGEPQLAVRGGAFRAPRVVRPAAELALPRDAESWRLEVGGSGGFSDLTIVDTPVVPLGATEIRIGVRVAGLNFRDVVMALGMVDHDGRPAATEGAGVVLEVGADVTGLAPGDRVMGLISGGVGPVSTTDHRLVTTIPTGWTFAEAAATPAVFLTAYYGLRDIADIQPGESVLVHAAAGGVGMAATQLARHWGADVYGTASPSKWAAVDIAEDHMASSRSLDFEDRIRAAAGTVDVVLNSLAGEFVDASLRLLPPGGRFVEMGKTDIRQNIEGYHSFDVMDAGPDRVREILAEITRLAEAGVVRPIPVTAWDIRRAPDAFRYLSQAKHVGKVVLTLPAPIDLAGTVLVTGANGTLGRIVTEHLVTRHGAKHLLLVGRTAFDAPDLDAEITVAACDVADRDALAALLGTVDRPLTAVFHLAGALADGTIESLTPEQLHTALRPKVDATANLHELVGDVPLVLFSSAAGTLGNAGQANYVAGNVYVDSLAQQRRALGLPATSMAWGFWALTEGMTGHLDATDRARVARSGVLPFTVDEGLAMFDDAMAGSPALAVLNRFDPKALRARAASGMLPSVLKGLTGSVRRTASAEVSAGTLTRQLAALPTEDQHLHVLDILRGHVATVLGHAAPEAIDAGRAMKELGFDSLSAVEFRNRLNSSIGLRLPSTVVFEYPTLDALATHVRGEVLPRDQRRTAPVLADLARLEASWPGADIDADTRTTVVARLRLLLSRTGEAAGAERIETADDDEIFSFIENELGIS